MDDLLRWRMSKIGSATNVTQPSIEQKRELGSGFGNIATGCVPSLESVARETSPDHVLPSAWAAYARERRARLQLEKRAPELLAKWHEAVRQVDQLLRGIGARSQLPHCCRQRHFGIVVRGSRGCACHKAVQWLEKEKGSDVSF